MWGIMCIFKTVSNQTKKSLWGCHNCFCNLRLWNYKFNLNWILGEIGGVKDTPDVNNTTEVQRIYTLIIKASHQNLSIQSILIYIKFWLMFKKHPNKTTRDLCVNRTFSFVFVLYWKQVILLQIFIFLIFSLQGCFPEQKELRVGSHTQTENFWWGDHCGGGGYLYICARTFIRKSSQNHLQHHYQPVQKQLSVTKQNISDFKKIIKLHNQMCTSEKSLQYTTKKDQRENP